MLREILAGSPGILVGSTACLVTADMQMAC